MTWKKESVRHALSSKGISTSHGVKDFRESNVPPKELYPVDYEAIYNEGYYPPIDTGGAERMIKLFWWCSSTDNWDWFDFDKAFDIIKSTLGFRINESFGEYASYLDDDFLNWKEVVSEMGKDDLGWKAPSVSDFRVRMFIEDFVSLHYRIDNYDYDLKGKISLFDEAIHIEHLGGNLFNIRDMDEFHEEFDEGPLNL